MGRTNPFDDSGHAHLHPVAAERWQTARLAQVRPLVDFYDDGATGRLRLNLEVEWAQTGATQDLEVSVDLSGSGVEVSQTFTVPAGGNCGFGCGSGAERAALVARLAEPPLSALQLSVHHVGVLAGQALMSLLVDGELVSLEAPAPKLIVRASTSRVFSV